MTAVTKWRTEVMATPPAPVAAVSTGPRLKVISAATVAVRRVVYVWEGRIPRGAVSLCPGEEGIGKSTPPRQVRAMTTATERTVQ